MLILCTKGNVSILGRVDGYPIGTWKTYFTGNTGFKPESVCGPFYLFRLGFIEFGFLPLVARVVHENCFYINVWTRSMRC